MCVRACVHACVRVWCVCVQDNAKRVQKRLLSKRRQPLELAADVVEHGLEPGQSHTCKQSRTPCHGGSFPYWIDIVMSNFAWLLR